MKLILTLTAILALGACATTPAPEPATLPGLTTPMAAVQAASNNFNQGVHGKFILNVGSVSVTPQRVLLHAENAHGNRNDFVIAVEPLAARKIARNYDISLQDLNHRRIVVTGLAQEVPINHSSNDGITTVYNQTWVYVKSPTQVKLVN